MNYIKLILIFLLIVLLNSFTGCKQALIKSDSDLKVKIEPDVTDQTKRNIPPYPIRFKLRNPNFATAVIETDEPIDNSSDEMSHLESDFEKLRASGIDTQEKIDKITKIADQCYENYVYAAFQKISDDNKSGKWQNLHIKIVDYLIPELIKLLDSTLEQYRKQIRSDYLIKNKAIASLNDSLAIIDNILKIYARDIDNDVQLNEKIQELKQKKEQIIKIIKIINDKKMK